MAPAAEAQGDQLGHGIGRDSLGREGSSGVGLVLGVLVGWGLGGRPPLGLGFAPLSVLPPPWVEACRFLPGGVVGKAWRGGWREGEQQKYRHVMQQNCQICTGHLVTYVATGHLHMRKTVCMMPTPSTHQHPHRHRHSQVRSPTHTDINNSKVNINIHNFNTKFPPCSPNMHLQVGRWLGILKG